jgi:hypothetical protein
MKTNVFLDKLEKPSEKKLSDALGTSYKYWEEFKKYLEEKYGEYDLEWKYYGQKIGWTLKVLRKKRNLFFFTPCDNLFRISFVFGDKAVSMVEQSNLPKTLIRELVNAKKYVEGRGIKIEIKSRKDIENIEKLVSIKIEN